MKSKMKVIKESFNSSCIYLGALLSAPSHSQVQGMLFALGVALVTLGSLDGAFAYTPIANYNDDRIAEAVDLIFRYINGTFGALIMVCAGIAAILSSAFGQYRAALGLLVVAVGSFILRSLVATWFNDTTLQSQ